MYFSRNYPWRTPQVFCKEIVSHVCYWCDFKKYIDDPVAIVDIQGSL